MRNFLLAAAAILAPAIAQADTNAQVDLSGSVESTLAIVATAANNTNLPLSVASQQTVKVATLAMGTNNSTGLTLHATWADLDKADHITPVGFSSATTGINASDATGATFTASDTDLFQTEAAGAASQALWIRYTPATFQDPGDYTSFIALSVSDNL
jgi:hypothetical protein